MHPAAHHHLGDDVHPQSRVDRTGVPVNELADLPARVEGPDPLHSRSPGEHCAARVPHELLVRRDDRPPVSLLQLGAVELLDMAEDEIEVRIALHRRDLERELVGHPQVISVQVGDQRPLGLADAAVDRRGRARGRLAHAADPRRVRGRHANRPVGRPVVDHYHLGGSEGLREDALERLRKVALAVAHRDDDADVAHQ